MALEINGNTKAKCKMYTLCKSLFHLYGNILIP